MDIQIDCSFYKIKIYIDKILHLSIRKEDFIGLQSWIEGEGESKEYIIEYVFKTTTIVSEYDSIDKWKSILNLLDKNI